MEGIPYFQEVIVMASTCDTCGYRNSELKPGGPIPEKGKKITPCVKNINDLSRDVIKSDTASVKVPELELELASGTLGGIVTKVEGLITNISESLERVHRFTFGDSLEESKKNKWLDFKGRLNKEWFRFLRLWDISSVMPQEPSSLLCSWSYLREHSTIWKFIPGVVLWSLWKARNSVVFENWKLDTSSLFFISRFRLAKWFLAKFPNVNIQVDLLIGDPSIADRFPTKSYKRKKAIYWSPPPTDFFKFNVDGATLVGEIGTLVSARVIVVRWIPRSYNSVADKLAKEGIG
ncbi:hypothetical protein F3Y22_tig00111741pilonHSYRG00005 [Hibiscus syriacus]|uniref:Zinc finger ZPR1-type domain-containing protein n=1 Tax=Hibiscus syriacus TaxID=106335 RepID=A0A6A2XFG2_HIBSY|nr:hypothetical protein F3Y22_tig00111741pilonHSYRG00005 [Hibiscus syriacus]